MVRELYRKSLFFRFATRYVAGQKGTALKEVTPEVLDEFQQYLIEQKFDYQEESEGKIKELKQIAERSHYGKDVLADLDLLSSALEKEKMRGFERYKDHIRRELNIELMARLKGERGRIEASLRDDVPLETAIGILKDAKLYLKKTKT
jgi:carboxyl-terminal processing protease